VLCPGNIFQQLIAGHIVGIPPRPRRQGAGTIDFFWAPAFAGMTDANHNIYILMVLLPIFCKLFAGHNTTSGFKSSDRAEGQGAGRAKSPVRRRRMSFLF
jgi:hypothetical protein